MTYPLDLLSKLQTSLNEAIVPDWKNKRTVDEFETECFLEIAELIECTEHKWWKHGMANPEKAKLELVDILHFALSGAILSDSVTEKCLRPLPKKANIDSYKYLIYLAAAHNFTTLIHHLVKLAEHLQFDIISYYIAKCTLNRIRLLKGYKEGKYKKINKEGVEDNDVLLSIIPKNSRVTHLDQPLEDDEIKIYKDMALSVYEVYGINENERQIW